MPRIRSFSRYSGYWKGIWRRHYSYGGNDRTQGVDVAANRALGHYTFEKNPLGSAAALATIEYIEQQNLLEHVRELGAQVEQHLLQLKDRYQSISDVRGRGLLWAIELVEDRELKTPAVGLASRVMYRCLERGVSFKVSGGSVLTLTPALTITYEKLFHALNIIEQSIAEG